MLKNWWTLLGFSALLFESLPAHSSAVPNGLTFQGRIIKPNGLPLEAAAVALNVKILSPANDCILLEENHNVPMDDSAGVFSIVIGTGTRAGADKGFSLSQVFKNSGTLTGLTCSSVSTTQYNALSGHSRRVRITFSDGTDTVTLNSDFIVRSVPYATIADSIQGKSPADFVQVNTTGTKVLSQTNLEQIFDGTAFTELSALIAGTSTQYAKSTALPVSGGSLDMSSAGKDIIVRDTPTSGNSAVNKDYVDSVISGAVAGTHDHDAADIVSGTFAAGLIPTGTDDTKLPLAGGTMTGDLDMGGKNILATGHITMSPEMTINLGTYDDAAEDLLDNGLGLADKGKFWYNTDSNQIKFWNGTAVAALGSSSSGIQSLNGATGNSQTIQLGTTGTSPNIATAGDVHTIHIPEASNSAKGVMSAGAGLTAASGVVTPDFGSGLGKVVQGNDDRLNPAPVIGDALSFIRMNAGGTAYEVRTPTQVKSDLGLGTMAAVTASDYLDKAGNLSGLANAGTARTNLGITATGDSVVTAASAGDARTAIGAAADNDARFNPAPVIGDAGKVVRVNAGGTGYEVFTLSSGGDFMKDGSVTMTGNIKLGGKYISNDGDDEGLAVDNSGKVGIGTSSPGFQLELAGSTATSRKIGVNGTQGFYLPDQANFMGSIFLGDGGGSLSHSSGIEGFFNTGVGMSAVRVNTTGDGNTGVGFRALGSNTTGSYNTASGYSALYTNTTAAGNTAYGYIALRYNTAGQFNTASGYGALTSNTTGSNNTAMGYNAGKDITTGSNNVVLGSDTGASIATLSNYVLIADGAGNRRVTIDSTGNVGIGTVSPHASALVDIASTTKGFLIPRMTEAERDAISAPAAGLQVYNTDDAKINFFDGTSWGELGAGGGGGGGDVMSSLTLTAGTGLTGGGDLSSNRTFAVDFGTGAGKVVQGNDVRLAPAPTGLGGQFVRVNAGATAYETVALGTMSSATATDYLDKAGNLSGLANAGTARTNLGLGTAATAASTDFIAAVTPGTSGNVLTSNGTIWTSAALPIATAAVNGIMNTGAGLVVSSGEVTPDFGTGIGKVVQGNDDRLAPAPVIGDAGKIVRVNAGGTGYEVVTPSGGGDFMKDGSVTMTGNIKLGGKYVSNDGDDEGLAVDNSGNVGIGTATPSVALDVSGKTDAIHLPSGNTAAQPASPGNGMMRYNSQTNKFEAYENGAWTNMISSGGVSTSRTITAGTGLTGGGDLTADRTLAVDFGTGSGKVVQGNDVRLAPAPTGLGGQFVRVNAGATAYETVALGTMSTATATDYLSKAGNLSGLADASVARTNLGLGTAATAASTDFIAAVTPGTSGNVLTSNGTIWTSAALPVATAAVNGIMNTGAGLVVSSGEVTPDFGTGIGKVTQGNDVRLAPAPILADAGKVVRVNAGGTGYEVFTLSGGGDFLKDGSVAMTGNMRLGGHWISNDGNNEGLRVDDDGNVGIGTATPNRKLYIAEDVAGLAFPLKLDNYKNGISTPGVGILFATEGDGSGGFDNSVGKGALVYQSSETWNRGDFHFLQNDVEDGTNPSLAHSVMTIKHTGAVGIGTAAPTAKLDVAGHTTTANTAQFGSFGFQSYALNNGSLAENSYFDGTDTVYRSDGYASVLQFIDGDINFITAPSGLAGTAATMTPRLSITNLGNVGIGNDSPDVSSILDIESTTKGILIPRMTEAERNAIATPAVGLQVYNTDDNKFNFYNGSAWAEFSVSSGVSTNNNAVSSITADFANTNMIRVTTSGACGTLDFTNVAVGGSYTITILGASATCTAVEHDGDDADVKLPSGYGAGGASVNGVVYTAIYDGTTLWVSYVPF